jgi:putative transposase
MKTNAAAVAALLTPNDDATIWEVDDVLWAERQPLLVIDNPRTKPGRPRHDDRPIFNGLIWLARTGAQWEVLPRRFGAKATVNARLLEWVAHGCFARAWARLLEVYDDEVGLPWEWQAADGCMVTAPLGQRGRTARPKPPAAPRPIAARAGPNGTC